MDGRAVTCASDAQTQSSGRTFTIVPIEGMEAIQKNFASYGQNGDSAAEQFLREKKLTLARRFQLIERGYVLHLKKDGRQTMFDRVHVRLILGGAEEQQQQKRDEGGADESKENVQVGAGHH